jgi:hypothetical protein
MYPTRPSSLSCALLLMAALLLPAPGADAFPVSPLSSITVGSAGPSAASPFDTTPVDSAGPADVTSDGTFFATAEFGSGGIGVGSSTLDGQTYWASVFAPNNHRQPVLSRGGLVDILLDKQFTKMEADATLSSIFTGFSLRLAFDPEFGLRCRPGDEDCLQAGWTWSAKVFDSDLNLTFEAIRFATVASDATKPSGFVFTELTTFLFGLDLQAGRNGITLGSAVSSNPAISNRMNVALALNEIEVGETFSVVYSLQAWAYDSGSDIGPGRVAHVFVQDPLDANLGVGFESTGLVEVGPGAPGVVPLPGSGWLLLAGGLALAAQRRLRAAEVGRSGCSGNGGQRFVP